MIFTKFKPTDIVSGRINQVSSGLFPSGKLFYNQSNFVTASININFKDPLIITNSEYYLNVLGDSELYFSIAYGDYENSGSSRYDNPDILTETSETTLTPPRVPVLNNETKVIYSQYKNILLQPGDTVFSFVSGSINTVPIESYSIFILNFAADKIKDQLDPGQLQLNFRAYNKLGEAIKGTNGVISLIDDSSVLGTEQDVYNLIRGKIINGVPVPESIGTSDSDDYVASPVYEGLGLFYPKNGIVILNAEKLNELLNIIPATELLTEKDVSEPNNPQNTYLVVDSSNIATSTDEFNDDNKNVLQIYRGGKWESISVDNIKYIPDADRNTITLKNLNSEELEQPHRIVYKNHTYREIYNNAFLYRTHDETNEGYKKGYRLWSINLFNSIKAVNSSELSGLSGFKIYGMCARKSEFVPSTTYFIRVKNREYNYTNNPTYVSNGTDGKIRGTILYQDLINNPRTYLTTIGLYNDNNELLAVGKLSQPWVKSFDNELLLKCKIDF